MAGITVIGGQLPPERAAGFKCGMRGRLYWNSHLGTTLGQKVFSMREYSIALIGIGHVAEYQLQALKLSKYFRIVAACDLDSQKSSLVPNDVKFTTEIDTLLGATDIDLYIISTPTKIHYLQAKKMIVAGMNVLVEKPCCLSSEELNDLVALSKEHNVFFHTAFHAMHALDVKWFLSHHADFGIDLSDLSFFSCGFFDPYYVDNKLENCALGLIDPWYDSGINALSVICKFIDPERLSMKVFRKTVSCGSFSLQCLSHFQWPQGKITGHGIIETSWGLSLNEKTTLFKFFNNGIDVLLHHSKEEVTIRKNGIILHIEDCSTAHPRLVNHYCNLLADTKQALDNRRSNIDYSSSIHKLLFDCTNAGVSTTI